MIFGNNIPGLANFGLSSTPEWALGTQLDPNNPAVAGLLQNLPPVPSTMPGNGIPSPSMGLIPANPDKPMGLPSGVAGMGLAANPPAPLTMPDIPAGGASQAGPAPFSPPDNVPMPPERPAFLPSESVPTPPPRPFDLPAAGAAPAGPAAAPAKSSGNAKSFWDVLGSIYGAGGPGDTLINLGVGLASQPTNWGAGLLKGLALTNAQNLTKKKKDDESRKLNAQNETARIIAQRTGIPYEQALGMVQSGNASQVLGTIFTKQTPQLVTRENPDGTKRQEWVIPGQPGGTAIGGGAVPPAAAPAPAGTAPAAQPSADGRTLTLADGTPVKFPGGNFNEWRDSITKENSKVMMAAPKAFDTLKSAHDAVAGLMKNREGLKDITSGLGAVWEMVPGSNARVARTQINQVVNQTFLSAYEALKGGGAITNVEGEKAQRAKARLDDPRIGDVEYRKALKEYSDALRDGMAKLQKVQSVTGREMPSQIDFGLPKEGQNKANSKPGGARIIRRID